MTFDELIDKFYGTRTAKYHNATHIRQVFNSLEQYESELANWNMEHNNLPTIFIPSTKELKSISSSGTKQS